MLHIYFILLKLIADLRTTQIVCCMQSASFLFQTCERVATGSDDVGDKRSSADSVILHNRIEGWAITRHLVSLLFINPLSRYDYYCDKSLYTFCMVNSVNISSTNGLNYVTHVCVISYPHVSLFMSMGNV